MDDNKDYKQGYYLLLFVDFLAQSNSLKKFDNLHLGDQPSEECIGYMDSVIKRSQYLNVFFDRLKNMISGQLNKLMGCYLDEAAERIKSIKDRELYKESYRKKIGNIKESLHIGVQRFSDSQLFYAKVDTDEAFILILQYMYQIVPQIMLEFLAESYNGRFKEFHAVPRGAIGFGYCWEINPNSEGKHASDIYGKALADAYYNEDKLAFYPRIILSDSVIDELRDMENRINKTWRDDNIGEKSVRDEFLDLVKNCKKNIIPDCNQKRVIHFFDYASNEMKEAWAAAREKGSKINCPKKIYSNAMSFAKERMEFYNICGDAKIRSKYKCLFDYLKSNKKYWL